MQRSKLALTGLGFLGLAMSAVAWPQDMGNTSSVVQGGRGNAAGILQTGSGNEAGIRQFGRGNTGVITQTGTGNTACLIQAGRNLDGSLHQVGDNQTSGVLQTRAGSRAIPVDLCTTATTRREVMMYGLDRPIDRARGRRRGAEP
jgi:Curlin associated repeat